MKSMTAFASKRAQGEWGSAVWELRAVNHRYFEVSFRLPGFLRELETSLRRCLTKHLHRGKLDVYLSFQADVDSGTEVIVNESLAKSLVSSAAQIVQLTQQTSPIQAMDILRWPGVTEVRQTCAETTKAELLLLFEEAVVDLNACRLREGDALKTLLQVRLEKIDKIVQEVQLLQVGIAQQANDKLLKACQRMVAEIEPNRLQQEVAILAQKYDVAEELDRLQTHVIEVTRVIDQEGAIGRRLDFLMQEINREANTLSAKAFNTEITAASVEVKVLVEQLREQVQNIE
ncbi:MAG: YicC/YloC family endoribonuclease [Gammaproteobacteria bacterium]